MSKNGWAGSSLPSPRRPHIKLSLSLLLVFVGVGLAFFLYQGAGDFFSWSRATPWSPLIAAVIGGASAVLLGFWLLSYWGSSRPRYAGTVLTSISLIWIGFGVGLFGPAALGREGSWEGGLEESAEVDVLESVMYSIDVVNIEIPPELEEAWSGGNPGPYVAANEDRLFVAVNSKPAPRLADDEEISRTERGEVTVGFLSTDSEGQLLGWTNLTELDSRIEHLRDIQLQGDRLVFSNVALESECMELQLWTAELSQDRSEVVSVEMIWASEPCLEPSMSPEYIEGAQSGGRIAVETDKSLLLSVGDFRLGLSVDDEYEGRPAALGPTASYGKILRVKPDGGTEVVSSGHRNPQGLTIDSATDEVWSSEHGPQGGGELNRIIEGADYGWPDITLGVPYGPNLPEGDWRVGRWGSAHEGFEKPILSWMPAIAPSQLLVYEGEVFDSWQGDVLLASLRDESLRRIRIEDDRVLFDERIEIGERVRDFIELGDGRLLLSFDTGGLAILSLIK